MADQAYWEFRVRKVHRIVDGDTYDLEVDLGFHQYGVYRFRLKDVNTPEIYGVTKDSAEYEAGVAASEFVSDWFAAYLLGVDHTIWIRTYGQQTFNRWVADVYVTGGNGEVISLGDELVEQGHGQQA